MSASAARQLVRMGTPAPGCHMTLWGGGAVHSQLADTDLSTQ